MTWEEDYDLLRCNPSFYRAPRYDGIIIDNGVDKSGKALYIFAKLLYVFTCVVDDIVYPIALTLPMDAKPGPRTSKDRELQIHRVFARPRQESQFYFLRSVVRGAALVEDSKAYGEYLVWDVIDDDMYLRIKQMFPDRKLPG